jgi:hypothetical protein
MSDTLNPTAGYTMARETEHGGLVVVRYYGAKVGTSQTESGARLVRRNHARRVAAEQAVLDREETQSDRAAWDGMDR